MIITIFFLLNSILPIFSLENVKIGGYLTNPNKKWQDVSDLLFAGSAVDGYITHQDIDKYYRD